MGAHARFISSPLSTSLFAFISVLSILFFAAQARESTFFNKEPNEREGAAFGSSYEDSFVGSEESYGTGGGDRAVENGYVTGSGGVYGSRQGVGSDNAYYSASDPGYVAKFGAGYESGEDNTQRSRSKADYESDEDSAERARSKSEAGYSYSSDSARVSAYGSEIGTGEGAINGYGESFVHGAAYENGKGSSYGGAGSDNGYEKGKGSGGAGSDNGYENGQGSGNRGDGSDNDYENGKGSGYGGAASDNGYENGKGSGYGGAGGRYGAWSGNGGYLPGEGY